MKTKQSQESIAVGRRRENEPPSAVSRILVQRESLHLWMIMGGIVSLMAALTFVFLTLRQERIQPRVFAVDGGGTIMVGPLEHLHLNSPIFQTTALWAAKAILERSPVGLNLPEVASGILEPNVRQRVLDEIKLEAEDFRQRRIHQHPEVSRIEALAEREDESRIIRLQGQLIRAANFGGMDDSEVVPFVLVLSLRPNPRLGQRGQYPFVVADYLLRFDHR
jgi:hypothetical protein